MSRIENLEDLRLVGFGVGVDLLARERRARGDAARGIADEAGEVADEEDDGVAHVLKVLELADEHGVAEVQVGSGGIEPGFHAHGLAGGDECSRRSRRSLSRMISAAPLRR